VALHWSAVHGLWSSQSSAVPAWHTPARHTSAPLHRLLSLQDVPVSGVWTQPSATSQESAVQGFPSSQLTAAPGWHVPEPHTLLSTQRPASQACVACTGVCAQPVSTSHASAVQISPSSQEMAVPGTQTPLLQLSLKVHALPASQAVPAAALRKPQPWLGPVQAPTRQTLGEAGQLSVPVPGWQTPPAHTSPTVQASLSEHDAVLLLCVQPLSALQPSSVQPLPSSQLSGVPARQPPSLLQVSAPLQTLPSAQDVPCATPAQ
jgi:hypothetical protein